VCRPIDILAEQHHAEAPRLSDGTFYTPYYDTDGSFSGYEVNTATYEITTDDSGHIAFEVFDRAVPDSDPYHSEGFDFTPALWRNLKALVASGIIDELVAVTKDKPMLPIAPKPKQPSPAQFLADLQAQGFSPDDIEQTLDVILEAIEAEK
jgi:hypothetical protein